MTSTYGGYVTSSECFEILLNQIVTILTTNQDECVKSLHYFSFQKCQIVYLFWTINDSALAWRHQSLCYGLIFSFINLASFAARGLDKYQASVFSFIK